MSWYYARGQEQVGPVEDGEFHRLVTTGQITAQTLVWQQGMADWQPYGQVVRDTGIPQEAAASPVFEAPQETSATHASPGIPCAQCGRYFSEADLIAYEGVHVCAECKQVYFQRIREGVGTGFVYAGFWIRFGAALLDGIIQWVVLMLGYMVIMMPLMLLIGDDSDNPLVIVVGLLMNLFSIGFGALYETWFVGRFAATPGKMACGLKVIKADGSPVSYLRALGRHFAKIISGIILMIGYIMAAFDSEKRALHDYICETRVVRK